MKKIGISIITVIIFQLSYAQTWQTYDSLHNVYLDKYCYDTAMIYAEKALHAVEKITGENDTLYTNMLTELMEVTYYNGNYLKAIEYAQKVKDIVKSIRGEKHPDYASALNNLAFFYTEMENYTAAELLYLEAINIKKEVQGVKHPAYAISLNNLAQLYEVMGNYSAAEPLFLEALNIRKEVLGEKNFDYAVSLNNLALLYKLMGNSTAAETLYIEAKNIFKENQDEKGPEYAKTLSNLGILYDDMGNHASAEPLYIESMNIRKKIYGEKHPSYANSLNNLACLYLEMGNYPAAELLFLKNKIIFKEILGNNHPSYATTLNNLAFLYKLTENYAAAESLYIESMNIRKEVLGENHPSFATSLNNLAGLYVLMGKYADAELLFLESVRIDKEALGEKHPDYATDLNNLANLYQSMGKYTAAKSLYIESLNIQKEVLGDNNPSYALSLYNLATVYELMGKYQEAGSLFLECITIINSNINRNFAFLSDKEKEMYFKTMTDYYESFYSFSLNRKSQDSGITKAVYNNVINIKGLLLKSSTAMRVAILNCKDTSLIAKYKEWIDLKVEISELYATEFSKRKNKPEELEVYANEIEKDLVRGSQIFGDLKKLQYITWESVRNSLKPGEAAIEFIRFHEDDKNDSILYCALIITSQSKQPQMIKLFYEKELKDILGTNNRNNFSCVKAIYGTKQNTDERLYQIIWQPMEKYLEGIKTVYYSPDGLLHKISFSSIGKGKDLYLCDNYSLNCLSSTGKIVLPEILDIGEDILIGIYGGIDYSADSTSENIWQYLEGTKNETDKIFQIFKTKKIRTNYLTGKKAEEKVFKETAAECNLLHIATHGFFYPEPEAIKKEVADTLQTLRGETNRFAEWQFVKNKNPLMRSGLVFARANEVWSQRFPGQGEDGVLTAQEVTQLNLQKTQLVVMSACETGLGDIKGSEGVYGLQRAFKMAGVKFLIMSLWQVPDRETSEFMSLFYQKLLLTNNIKKSFNDTQSEMRKKYDPFFWAAFVLIE